MGSGFRRMLRKAKAAAQAQQAVARSAASVANADTPKGRRVVIGDVAPYAMSGHPKCRGNGMESGNPNALAPCPCAIKRFHKAHPEIVVDAAGDGWWPAEAKAEPAG